mmetsp:Transcript_15105/g.14681  ORF Transcript_15105/g.14681 Transcript_15105/m.14681 type:complete len:134 (+) Transcript_15105:299-700(+)
MNEVLSLILREEEQILLDYATSFRDKEMIQGLLRNQQLLKIETVKDIFMDDAFEELKDSIIDIIKQFVRKLFNIFDILFALFVSVCFVIVTMGVFYFINSLQKLTIQIYHIVLLIPYGQRTKRELNELLKIKL